jgi:HTH-type transcriptional regulator/antitoxin HigA
MYLAQVGSEADYQKVMAEIRQLAELEPDRGTPQGERIEALAMLVEAYEADSQRWDPEDAQNR